jgi:phage terminase large subunit
MTTTTINRPSTVQRIDLGYRARRQFHPFHARRQRWACLVAHRRAGKTVACIMDTVDAALRCQLPSPRFAYVAPFYAQAKDIAWTYLKRYTAPIPGAVHNEGELRVDLPGDRRVRLYGADNYDRMRGIYLDGCILDEPADMDPRAWPEVIRPALSDRRGWACFIGTPKGRNGFWEIYEHARQSPDWFSAVLRASETGLLPKEELDDARTMMTPEQYEQEYECSFDAAILGAYYGKEIAEAERTSRIGTVNPADGVPVQTAWDLGIGDSTSIWFWQVAGREVRIVDHYENHGQPLSHYVAAIKSKGYNYGAKPRCWVPHDARVRSLETGRTRVETLTELGMDVMLVPDHKVDDGINAARVSFPRFWIDAERCKFGIEALRQYRTDFDQKLKAFKNTPKHDWTSHTADAFRYLAMAWRATMPDETKPHPIAALLKPVTFDDLMDDHDGD